MENELKTDEEKKEDSDIKNDKDEGNDVITGKVEGNSEGEKIGINDKNDEKMENEKEGNGLNPKFNNKNNQNTHNISPKNDNSSSLILDKNSQYLTSIPYKKERKIEEKQTLIMNKLNNIKDKVNNILNRLENEGEKFNVKDYLIQFKIDHDNNKSLFPYDNVNYIKKLYKLKQDYNKLQYRQNKITAEVMEKIDQRTAEHIKFIDILNKREQEKRLIRHRKYKNDKYAQYSSNSIYLDKVYGKEMRTNLYLRMKNEFEDKEQKLRDDCNLNRREKMNVSYKDSYFERRLLLNKIQEENWFGNRDDNIKKLNDYDKRYMEMLGEI